MRLRAPPPVRTNRTDTNRLSLKYDLSKTGTVRSPLVIWYRDRGKRKLLYHPSEIELIIPKQREIRAERLGNLNPVFLRGRGAPEGQSAEGIRS